eukprot:COSAG01_NODE_73804_length_235_cov_105.220588_1_plen_48_part_01
MAFRSENIALLDLNGTRYTVKTSEFDHPDPLMARAQTWRDYIEPAWYS